MVSQLLYAFSPKGQNLNHPLKFAISQIIRPGDGDLGHNPRHDRLASLGPAGLQELIKNSKWDGFSGLSIDANILGAQDWERIMKGHKNNAFPIELGELLGLLKISY